MDDGGQRVWRFLDDWIERIAMMQPYHDTIRVIGLKFVAAHGVHESERVLPQPFEVDVEVKLDLSAAAASDQIADTVDYAGVAGAVQTVIDGEPHYLVEKLAGLIIERVGELIGRGEVTVRIRKPRAPITIPFETVEVELRRRIAR